MGQGKTFDYKKILEDLEKVRVGEGLLFAGRITAVYGGGPTSTGEWTPAVDVYETSDTLVLVAEVPGLSQEDMRLEVAGNILTLKGFRPFNRQGIAADNYYRMEFAYGNFERSFALPSAVREGDVEAVLKDGVLTVRLPLADAVRDRKIDVSEE